MSAEAPEGPVPPPVNTPDTSCLDARLRPESSERVPSKGCTPLRLTGRPCRVSVDELSRHVSSLRPSPASLPRSRSSPLIIVRPPPPIPGMPLSVAISSSVSASFFVFALNSSFRRTLPSGHTGVLPFLHTPVSFLQTRCPSMPEDVPALAASTSSSGMSSTASRMPTQAFSMVRHSLLQTPPTTSPCTWFSSLRALPRLTTS
mmetsp:Transcript_48257/g.108699  ORF Transcript_48257/g.108699 Transcript_48257/m.108699 type:complete len:203 (-) Transcript_48257:386-994(-)